MRLSAEFAAELAFGNASAEVVSRSLLEMPLLISERSLTGNEARLASYAKSVAMGGHTPEMEIISMPKRGYGPRPIGLLSPAARALYEALVEKIKPALPTPSREQGFSAHLEFGLDTGQPSEVRIVDLDIAACYEYVDHDILAGELLTQGADALAVRSLTEFLGYLFPRRIGLPQALTASHLLADVYLNRMERGILRAGYKVNRFADDFRLVAPNWGSVYRAIESIVEEARALGLTLADGKTRIHSVDQLLAIDREREAIFDGYRARAADDLRSLDFVQVGYEDFELEETEASEEDVDFEALKRIVEDWVQSDVEQRTVHASFGARALRVLQDAQERLPDDWLVEIVSREPPHLRNVLRYLSARPERQDNWKALSRLAALPRTSPWAKLWILHVADTLVAVDGADRERFDDWAERCLDDPHESVRAEAAWLLAASTSRPISTDRLGALFVASSTITHCGLAAAAGRLDSGIPSTVGKALRSESTLAQAAYDWASAG